MNTKSITIITPTYNRAHTLQRVYDSLLRQTFQDFVWLIMDDGSTDETKQLVDEFVQEKKIEIHYIYHENQHKFITVFEGVKKVKTPYFMVVDSDDSYPQTSLEVLFDEVERINNQDEYISVWAYRNTKMVEL